MRTVVAMLLASLAGACALAGTAFAADATPPPAPVITSPESCSVAPPSPSSELGLPLIGFTSNPDPESGTVSYDIEIDGVVVDRILADGPEGVDPVPAGVHVLRVVAVNGDGLRTPSDPVEFRLGPGDPPCGLPTDTTPPPAPEITSPGACAVVDPSPYSARGMPVVGYVIHPDPESGTHGHEVQLDGEVIRTDAGGELPGDPIPLGVHTLRVVAINGVGLRTASEVVIRLGPGEPPCTPPSDPPAGPASTDATPPPAPEITSPTACQVVASSPYSGRGMPVVGHRSFPDPESGTPQYEIELDGQVVRTHTGGELPGPAVAPGVHTLRVIAINGAGLRTASEPVVFRLGAGAPPCTPPPAGAPPPAGSGSSGVGTPAPAGPPASGSAEPPATSGGAEAPPVTDQAAPPTVRVARAAGGRLIQLRMKVDGAVVTLRRRARRDGTVVLPAALADATALGWRPWRAANWRGTKRIRTQDRRRRAGKAYLVRVSAAPKTKVKVRIRRGRTTLVLTRRVLSGRRVKLPGRSRAARWRLTQSAWRAPVRTAATS